MSEDVLDRGSFNKNYRVLKERADWLSKQEETDINLVVSKVERAMQAYRICKDRLDRVEETLGQYLQGDNAKPGDGKPEAEAGGLACSSRISSSGTDRDGLVF